MAMRPRDPSGHRAPALSVFQRTVYEDFRPFSEWKQVEGADVLLIHLPGFMREQIKTTFAPVNLIKARGERLLANNAWSRFNQDFHIPKDCDVRGIRAQFNGGILYITMPKIIAQTTPKTTANLQTERPKTTITEPQKGPDEDKTKVDAPNPNPIEKDLPKFKGETSTKSPSPTDVATGTDSKKLTPKDKPTTPKTEKVETLAEKIVESIIGKKEPTTQSIPDDIKPIIQKKSVQNMEQVVPKPQKINEDTKTIVDMKPAQKVERDRTNLQMGNDYRVKSENINKETNDESTQEGNFVKQLLKKAEKTNEHISNRHDNESAKEHNFDVNKLSRADEIENLKKIVKEFGMKIKEEKEAVINIGVAVLVIVSLGVYVSYTTFGNSRI